MGLKPRVDNAVPTPATTTLPRSVIARFSIGSLGTGGFGTLPGLVLIYFLTDTLGVTAALAGLIILVAKIWDVLIDPIIGDISDASARKTGTRARLMTLGAIFLPIFFFATFAVPGQLHGLPAALWVLFMFIACATAFSMFQVPYIALPAELTPNYDERTRLLTWRVVILSAAILAFGGGGPILRSLGGDNERLGYIIMALVAGAIIGIGFIIAARVAPRNTPDPTAPSPLRALRLRETLKHYTTGIELLKTNQPFRVLLATFFLQALATGMMLAGAQYVAKWVLNSEAAITNIFVALIAPALLMAPVWGNISAKIGKEKSFMYASIIFMAGALMMTALLIAPGPWIYLPVALCGAAYAGMQSLPMAMLPDTITHATHNNKDSQAGIYGGVWTAGETTGMALGSTALTIVLALTGYIESLHNETVTQPDSAVTGIILAFSIIPAAAILISLFALRTYPLRKHDIDNAVTQ
ncbi:MFS transporter [Timonella sp. A28]|uniref:MFS transporter n=1 Tax=Timonella sp. A28 TaxID=3442640 RepID=UPI003EC14E88